MVSVRSLRIETCTEGGKRRFQLRQQRFDAVGNLNRVGARLPLHIDDDGFGSRSIHAAWLEFSTSSTTSATSCSRMGAPRRYARMMGDSPRWSESDRWRRRRRTGGRFRNCPSPDRHLPYPIAVRMSSMLRPSRASAVGLTRIRTAGRFPPLMRTSPTPGKLRDFLRQRRVGKIFDLRQRRKFRRMSVPA